MSLKDSTGILVLNVGGTFFETSLSTLESKGGFFAAVARRCSEPGLPPSIFVDRDPTHFRWILNYLRGSKCLPSDPVSLEEIRTEADFYSLNELIYFVTQKEEEVRREAEWKRGVWSGVMEGVQDIHTSLLRNV